MLHKSFDIIDTKADSDAGTFEATVAVFGNVDLGGDRIVSGAFGKSLADWRATGDPIPVILSHQWDNPMAHIGVVDDVKETTKGLWVKGTLDVQDNDVARQVHRLMKRRSLKQFSFGYSVPKGGSKRAKDGANELSEVELYEVGPTLKGMNPATELHAVKSALGVEDETPDAKASGMAGVLERMATLVDRQEAPSEDEAIALANYILSQFGKSDPPVAAESTLQNVKDADGAGKGTTRSRPVDPLEQKARTLIMDVLAEGSKPPEQAPARVEATPDKSPEDLKSVSRALMVQLLSS